MMRKLVAQTRVGFFLFWLALSPVAMASAQEMIPSDSPNVSSTANASASDSASSRAKSGSPWNVSWDSTEGDARETWSLFDSVDSPIEFGGWMSGGYTGNGHGNLTENGNAPLPNNNVSDGAVLNQLWVYAGKPVDTSQRCYDWGFRIDYVFGADAPDTQASGDRGWDFGWNTSRDYGSAIPQLYFELAWQNVIARVGHAIGLQGYEAVQSIDNFFYSHNYAFGYGVPGTMSGLVFDYQVDPSLNLLGGWTMGWDSWWSNYISASTFKGGMKWNPSERFSIAYYLTAGDFGDGTARNGVASNSGSIYAHAIIVQVKLDDRTTYVLENTLGTNTGAFVDDNQWYSITQYLAYRLNPCWAVASRLEWFRDEDGRRVAVNGAGPGSYYETTLGLNWSPHANLRIRPEVRWDWFSGQGLPFDSRNGGASGTESNQFTAGVDLVLEF